MIEGGKYALGNATGAKHERAKYYILTCSGKTDGIRDQETARVIKAGMELNKT